MDDEKNDEKRNDVHVLQRYLTPTALRIQKSPIRLIMQRAAKIEGNVAKLGGGQPQSKMFPLRDNTKLIVPVKTFTGELKNIAARIDTPSMLNYVRKNRYIST